MPTYEDGEFKGIYMLEKLNRIITTPAENLGKVARFFVFQIRVWPQCIKLLKKNRAGQQAAALSYYSIFGLIPIAIVMLLIFQSFPAYQELGEKFRDYLYDYVQLSDIQYPDPSNPEVVIRATDHIDKLAKGFFAESGRGSITIFSVIVIIYAALGFLTTIERTFNNIWHVSRGRGFVQRMVNYWALTLVPLLAVGGIYLSSKIAEFCKLDGLSSIGFLRPVQSYICLLYTSDAADE